MITSFYIPVFIFASSYTDFIIFFLSLTVALFVIMVLIFIYYTSTDIKLVYIVLLVIYMPSSVKYHLFNYLHIKNWFICILLRYKKYFFPGYNSLLTTQSLDIFPHLSFSAVINCEDF